MGKLVQGILPALSTPFDDQMALAVDRVPALVRALIDAGTNGFFICGGTGEGRRMTVDERRRMCETVVRIVARQTPVIFHVGGTTTEDAVALSRDSARLGADAVASIAPVDRPNSLDDAVRHYAAIGGAGDLPFYVYWLAQDADRSVDPAQFLEAMKTVPNFAGVKFTDPNFYLFQQLIDLSGGTINAITGPDEMCVAGMAMGSDGAIGTTYNIMPRLFVRMYEAFHAGRVKEAMDAQVKANRVIALLISVGVLAGVKAMLGWRGLPVGPPRPPVPMLSPENEQRLRDGLAVFDFDIA
ncbi:MAG: dihydrodipicolinate synthase family protein [candidate division Zixibacteria bacterium]|nr:dihydrodipicolinate synthase family protein [candidate division Zixibacteria bacterium]